MREGRRDVREGRGDVRVRLGETLVCGAERFARRKRGGVLRGGMGREEGVGGCVGTRGGGPPERWESERGR